MEKKILLFILSVYLYLFYSYCYPWVTEYYFYISIHDSCFILYSSKLHRRIFVFSL